MLKTRLCELLGLEVPIILAPTERTLLPKLSHIVRPAADLYDMAFLTLTGLARNLKG